MEIRDLASYTIGRSEKFAEIISACSTLLKHSSEAAKVREYLQSRIPKPPQGFTFGYFPPNEALDELLEFVSLDDLMYLNLVYKKYVYDSGQPELMTCATLARHNLILPYKNMYGDIIGLVGRTLLSKNEQKALGIPKYKNTSLLKSLNLFGMYRAKQHILTKNSVIIVEGQMDCITCHQAGYQNVVALGGSAFTKFHFFLIKRYTNNIYLCLDNDEAGRRETNNIINRYSHLGRIIPITLPDCYKDIDECIRKGGDANLLNI